MQKSNRKLRVAFIKFAGMTIGGSELVMQKIAANLPKDQIDIDFYYCDDAPYAGANHAVSPTSQGRIDYVKQAGVNIIKFNVGKKDVRWPTHPWIDSDFFEKFDPKKYDLVFTVKAGPKEYPYYKIDLPVVEEVALALRPDKSANIAWSFHSSPWQRAQWVRKGGSVEKSSVLSGQIEVKESTENYRGELGIPRDAIVAGFHQRADNNIASPIPLQAFANIQKKYPNEARNWHFIIKNGGTFYRDQAKQLGLKNMHFLGATPDADSVSKFLNTLNIFAHGRKDGETFGAVLVEAMVHGLPCLSHHTEFANAQPETMGPAGMFAQDGAEYEKMLHKLFSDASLRAKLSSKARPFAKEYHSMDRCINQVLDVYEKVSGIPVSRNHAKREPMQFGWSDMGFLYAGDLNKRENIAYHVLSGGIPEAFDVALVRSLLPGTATFLDIGANTGIYCWLAADYYVKNNIPGNQGTHSKVIAYEPQPECVEALNKTIYLNNWESVATIQQIGLGSATGKINLQISGTGSSVVPGFVESHKPSITIDIDTVDRQVQKENIKKVDFIKIDVEGHEFEVLKGATQTIEKDTPILFLEIARRISSRNYENENYTKTLEWIAQHGYRIWISENNNLKEIKPDFLHKNNVAMYLCLHPKKHADKIAGLDATVREYREKNLYFGMIEKRLVEKARRQFVPEYVTMKNVKKYLLRKG